MNILYEPFPECITADGECYGILTDFREWLRFGDLLQDEELGGDIKALLMAEWIIEPPPCLTTEMMEGLMAFYRADALFEAPQGEEAEEPHPPWFDFTIDARWIIGDFLRYYRLDLLGIDYLHWWHFCALLSALPDDSTVMKRVAYRSAKLGEIKNPEERRRIARIQRRIAIPYKMDEDMIGEIFSD